MNKQPKKIDVNEAVMEYYKLKEKYDHKFDIKKNKIINTTLDINTKRKEIQTLRSKQKCIICNNTGGTIFSNVNGILRAVCGNKAQPCGLNIEIKKGKVVNLENLTYDSYKKVENTKDMIIRLKLDLLFNFISEDQLVKKFQEVKKKLDKDLKIYEELSGQLINLTDSKLVKTEIERKQILLQMNIEEIKKLVTEFDNTGEISNIKDVIRIYLNEIIPLTDEITNSKYKYNAIEYDSDDDTYHLIQKKYTNQNIEKYIDSAAVISYSL